MNFHSQIKERSKKDGWPTNYPDGFPCRFYCRCKLLMIHYCVWCVRFSKIQEASWALSLAFLARQTEALKVVIVSLLDVFYSCNWPRKIRSKKREKNLSFWAGKKKPLTRCGAVLQNTIWFREPVGNFFPLSSEQKKVQAAACVYARHISLSKRKPSKCGKEGSLFSAENALHSGKFCQLKWMNLWFWNE